LKAAPQGIAAKPWDRRPPDRVSIGLCQGMAAGTNNTSGRRAGEGGQAHASTGSASRSTLTVAKRRARSPWS
jgi:hypothetical protein